MVGRYELRQPRQEVFKGHFNPENASCIMWATTETAEQMHCMMWATIETSATEATKTGSVRAISTLKSLHDVGYYGNL